MGTDELDNQDWHQLKLPLEGVGQQPHAVPLHCGDTGLQAHEPIAVERAFDQPHSVHGFLSQEFGDLVEQIRRLRRIAEHSTLVLKRGVGNHPALTPLANDLVGFEAHVREKNFVEGRVTGHGHQGPDLDSGGVHRQEQVADALVFGGVRLGAHQHKHHV